MLPVKIFFFYRYLWKKIFKKITAQILVNYAEMRNFGNILPEATEIKIFREIDLAPGKAFWPNEKGVNKSCAILFLSARKFVSNLLYYEWYLLYGSQPTQEHFILLLDSGCRSCCGYRWWYGSCCSCWYSQTVQRLAHGPLGLLHPRHMYVAIIP